MNCEHALARARAHGRTAVYAIEFAVAIIYLYTRGIRLHGHSALASMTLNVIILADNK